MNNEQKRFVMEFLGFVLDCFFPLLLAAIIGHITVAFHDARLMFWMIAPVLCYFKA